MLGVPFVFGSNGDGFFFHNSIAKDGNVETEITLDEFPSPEFLWNLWRDHKNLTPLQETIIIQDYNSDGSNKTPRYYQLLAINRTIEAIANGNNRISLHGHRYRKNLYCISNNLEIMEIKS